jgi:DNA-binding MarR family transcriptional regulator
VTQSPSLARAASGGFLRSRKAAGVRVEGIDYGPLANWLGFHLHMAQIASFQAFAAEVGEVGLPPGRFALLTLIGRNPGISQTALSRAARRDKSTLTPALRDLRKRDLIVCERPAQDRRSYRLSLTPAGQAMLRRLTHCAARHEHTLDRIVGARDRPRLMQLLRKIMAALE